MSEKPEDEFTEKKIDEISTLEKEIFSELEPKKQKEGLLVPSSMEMSSGGVERYIISKQISRMDEPRKLTNDDFSEKRIIYPEAHNRYVLNRFRELRTRLLEISKGNNFTLVVTSPADGSGTSFVALNLATAFALDSSKTALIIDCNLRDPSLHEALDLIPETGLTDFLENQDLDIGSVIYPSGIQRLRIVPAGSRRESPSEFFTSFRMKQFLHTLRRRYPDRFIFIDAPSIQDSPDARILVELCDYALLVIPHSRLTESQIISAVKLFDKDKFAGVVING